MRHPRRAFARNILTRVTARVERTARAAITSSESRSRERFFRDSQRASRPSATPRRDVCARASRERSERTLRRARDRSIDARVRRASASSRTRAQSSRKRRLRVDRSSPLEPITLTSHDSSFSTREGRREHQSRARRAHRASRRAIARVVRFLATLNLFPSSTRAFRRRIVRGTTLEWWW